MSEIDYMQEYKNYGRTPDGLRKFAKMLMRDRVFGGGYAECVLLSASDEIALLRYALEQIESNANDIVQAKTIAMNALTAHSKI